MITIHEKTRHIKLYQSPIPIKLNETKKLFLSQNHLNPGFSTGKNTQNSYDIFNMINRSYSFWFIPVSDVYR